MLYNNDCTVQSYFSLSLEKQGYVPLHSLLLGRKKKILVFSFQRNPTKRENGIRQLRTLPDILGLYLGMTLTTLVSLLGRDDSIWAL